MNCWIFSETDLARSITMKRHSSSDRELLLPETRALNDSSRARPGYSRKRCLHCLYGFRAAALTSDHKLDGLQQKCIPSRSAGQNAEISFTDQNQGVSRAMRSLEAPGETPRASSSFWWQQRCLVCGSLVSQRSPEKQNHRERQRFIMRSAHVIMDLSSTSWRPCEASVHRQSGRRTPL